MKGLTIVATVLLVGAAGQVNADQGLAQAKGCLHCHQVEKKFVGPALRDVSNKYKGDPKAEGIIAGVLPKGSKGVWGPVPMPPQKVTPDEARALARWILAL